MQGDGRKCGDEGQCREELIVHEFDGVDDAESAYFAVAAAAPRGAGGRRS